MLRPITSLQNNQSCSLDSALPTGLLGAVRALREGLRLRGSNLLLRMGPLGLELPALARELSAAAVVAEEEVEHRQVLECP